MIPRAASLSNVDVPLISLSFEEHFFLIILLLFVLDSTDRTGTCLVFTAPSISPPSYIDPGQHSL